MGQSLRKINTYGTSKSSVRLQERLFHKSAVMHVQVVNMEDIQMFVSNEVQWKHILQQMCETIIICATTPAKKPKEINWKTSTSTIRQLVYHKEVINKRKCH